MRYFKRRWEESRGDSYDHWGISEYFFEIDEDGYPVRQLENYDSGHTLKYDRDKLSDEFGGLGDQALDLIEFEEYEISASQFEAEWIVKTAHNK